MITSKSNWKLGQREDADRKWSELVRLKANDEKSEFNTVLMPLVLPIGIYISNEIDLAENKEQIPPGKYTISDIIDDLIIKTFDQIELIGQGADFTTWLYQQADRILEDLIIEEEFNHYFFTNIDEIGNKEWEAMDEIISRDGDGDLVMIEELDDQSYPKYEYSLDEVFTTDNEKAQIERLDNEIIREKANRSVAKILRHLPLEMRNIYNLYHQHKMDIKSISIIKKKSEQYVEEVLTKVQKSLKQVIEGRLEDSKMMDSK